jgi:predicted ATPase
LHEPIVAKHGYFGAGKFDQYQRDIPYATITQAFRELVRQLLAESEVRIAGWRQRIQTAVGVNGQLIGDVLPCLARNTSNIRKQTIERLFMPGTRSFAS